MIKTIQWEGEKVVILDQNKLPQKRVYLNCFNHLDVARAIKKMAIRGAPALGVAAAMGIALGAQRIKAKDFVSFKKKFDQICEDLIKTRPTAFNLFWSVERMKKSLKRLEKMEPSEIKRLLQEESLKIAQEDLETNLKIGAYGKELLKDQDTVLTYCNAGSLATSGYGTALGVIRAAHEEKKRIRVIACETRPLLQGARLTTWELLEDQIPVTLVTDNMAGYLMQRGMVNLVLVGADRIAPNGDVVNKIGTYTLAILAQKHGIPFFVAAPLSTLDWGIKGGREIPIEEREEKEVTQILGRPIAPRGIKALNFAFDLTPNRYLSGIITEKGIARRPYGQSLKRFIEEGREKD